MTSQSGGCCHGGILANVPFIDLSCLNSTNRKGTASLHLLIRSLLCGVLNISYRWGTPNSYLSKALLHNGFESFPHSSLEKEVMMEFCSSNVKAIKGAVAGVLAENTRPPPRGVVENILSRTQLLSSVESLPSMPNKPSEKYGAMMSTIAWSIKSWLMEKRRDIQSAYFLCPTIDFIGRQLHGAFYIQKIHFRRVYRSQVQEERQKNGAVR
ncbi:hypothetical protein NC652_024412 [Populus alba x Populus x berolinensis]|nr:hypothetical protein NC652_024412 [Populus alba x Populus x berolinensis]